MNRTRIIRCLRFAYSATCLVARVLLIALWVRSYFCADLFGCDEARSFTLTAFTAKGRIVLWLGETRSLATSIWYPIPFDHVNMESFDKGTGFETYIQNATSRSGLSRVGIQLPLWFVVLLVAVFTTLPWLRWRFSLRTLLIATTLVAILLGTAVVLSR